MDWTEQVFITDRVEGTVLSTELKGDRVKVLALVPVNPDADHFLNFSQPPFSEYELDRAAKLIQGEVEVGNKVVVHCNEGIEWAPLVVAWWLHR